MPLMFGVGIAAGLVIGLQDCCGTQDAVNLILNTLDQYETIKLVTQSSKCKYHHQRNLGTGNLRKVRKITMCTGLSRTPVKGK